MAQFIEFILNHWMLSALWVVILGAIVVYQQRSSGSTVGPQQAVLLINRSDAVVVDLREKKEFDTGHIVDSMNIPMPKLKQRMTELNKHKSKPVILVCKLGQQASEAARMLNTEGYESVYRLSGGITEWKAQSLPLVQK